MTKKSMSLIVPDKKNHSSLKSLLLNSCSVSMWYTSLQLNLGNPLRDTFDSELQWNFLLWALSWVVVVLPGVVNETGLCGVVVEATWLFFQAHRFIIIFWPDIRRKKACLYLTKKSFIVEVFASQQLFCEYVVPQLESWQFNAGHFRFWTSMKLPVLALMGGRGFARCS